MQWLLILALMALNFFISWVNARQVGLAWYDSKAAGGWPRFLVWMVALMSASGFTWVYLYALALLMYAMKKFDVETINGFLYMGYVVIIPGVLISGLAIGLQSWAVAYRERSLASVGTAGWNTFANIYNLSGAIRTMPKAFEGIGKIFGSSKNNKLQLILLVLIAILAGALTTYYVAYGAAQTVREKVKNDFLEDKRKRDFSFVD